MAVGRLEIYFEFDEWDERYEGMNYEDIVVQRATAQYGDAQWIRDAEVVVLH